MSDGLLTPERPVFHLTTEVAPSSISIRIGGELDVASTLVLERAVRALLGNDSRRVVLDLRGLDFIDSAGISLVVRLNALHDPRLGVIPARAGVQRAFAIAGLDRLAVFTAAD